jgi:hypothetical protein
VQWDYSKQEIVLNCLENMNDYYWWSSEILYCIILNICYVKL